jgi:signal transduction histidine kinase
MASAFHMGTRSKILLFLTVFGIVPVIALSVVNYLMGVRAVEASLRKEVEREARGIARDVELGLREREEAILALARSPALRAYVRGAGKAEQSSTSAANSPRPQSAPTASALATAASVKPSIDPAQVSSDEKIPKDVQGEIRSFIQSGQKYYVSVACLSASRQPRFRAEPGRGGEASPVHFQTQDFLSESVRPDERVWSTGEAAPLRSEVTRESFGSVLRYTVPLFAEEAGAVAAGAPAERGALMVDLKLDALLGGAAGSAANSTQVNASAPTQTPRLVVILDRTGNAIYHSNDALKYQPAEKALPASFRPITEAMSVGRRGWRFYESLDGHDWLAAYQPVAPLDLSVAVAGDYSAAVQGLRFWGWLSTGLIALILAGATALLLVYLRRTARSIERVTEGAVAIAGGKLDERIEVRSSDETRVLAETFNAMGDRLRDQIAREAESRQFESFMRLSAMLTHDLKNSILALSLIVNNMEQKFHREEFRMDAMQSLRDATSQLGALVAKLSEPVRSLSGEFKRPRPVDLIPVIRRALSRTAEPAAEMHDVEIELPSTLVAIADDERIEKVVDNLVLNAIEAMGAKRGRLSVRAGPAEEGFVFFSVSDTGQGMTEEFQRTRLFRPFATTKPKGVGLGLYTCRELVRALGGRVEVESKRGSGTCFRVVLPSGAIVGAGQKSSRTE